MSGLKLVYVYHNRMKELDPVLLIRTSDGVLLTDEELESIFEAHNFSEKRKLPALTGFFEWDDNRMGVVDPDTGIVYECLPVGWKRTRT